MKQASMLLCCALWALPTFGNTLNEGALAQKINLAQQAEFKRFGYLRFYIPNNQLPDPPSLWDRIFSPRTTAEHEHALAIYLFNMYVSTRVYQQPKPLELSLNYVGVLDGFSRGGEPFDFANASEFYKKHQQAVDALITQFHEARTRSWPTATVQEYEHWLSLLQAQPQKKNQATYSFPTRTLFSAPLPDEIIRSVTTPLQHARQQAQHLVLAYNEPDIQLSDYDRHIGNYTSRRKRTYRWVKEECYYSSYLIARELVQHFAQHNSSSGTLRLYLLTAYPKSTEFLAPAHLTRFPLADGGQGLHWRYHTAVLAIVPYHTTYIPVVLDTFLGGDQPLSLGEWVSQFHKHTVFTAVPFKRNGQVENALKRPDRVDGNNVWINKESYAPVPVEE